MRKHVQLIYRGPTVGGFNISWAELMEMTPEEVEYMDERLDIMREYEHDFYLVAHQLEKKSSM